MILARDITFFWRKKLTIIAEKLTNAKLAIWLALCFGENEMSTYQRRVELITI